MYRKNRKIENVQNRATLNVMKQLHNEDLPKFIIRSTLGVSITTVLLLIPYAIISFINERYVLGMLMLVLLMICGINIWFSLNNRYVNWINILGLSFLTITIVASFYKMGSIVSYWPYMVIAASYSILPKKQAWAVNILFIAIISPVVLSVLEHDAALRFFSVLIGVSFFSFFTTNEIYKQHYLLKEQAVTDSLTGVYNRSLLQISLENSVHQSERSNIDMTIFMIDIDNFKKINDQFGHDMGDLVLKSTGELLNGYFRGSDRVFRVAGEEFLVLVYNTDGVNAVNIAENLRREFAQLPLVPNHAVTISIGVSGLQSDMNWKQWMKQCDDNLYQAKSNGRNKVVS